VKIDRQLRVLLRRFLTQGGVGVDVAVTAGAATKAIAFADGKHEPNASYAVLVTPSWLTTFRVTAKATTGFTIDFGTVAPAAATVSYAVLKGDI
jgi:tetrahydromethanopterin S-methyltransferase subunit E